VPLANPWIQQPLRPETHHFGILHPRIVSCTFTPLRGSTLT
jgi:hypothetical protein